MKKKTGLLVAMLFIMIFSVFPVFAETFVSTNGDYEYEVRKSSFGSGEDVAVLTDYIATSSDASIVVPSEIDGYEVEELDGTFENNGEIKRVAIKSGIKIIGFNSFENCLNLKSINIPDSVEAIYSRTFAGSGITSIKFPPMVTELGDGTFQGCKDLKTVDFSDSNLEDLGSYTFSGCINLENITLPDMLKRIGECSFWWCDKITTFIIPENVTRIDVNSNNVTIGGENLRKVINNSNYEFELDVIQPKDYREFMWFTSEDGDELALSIPPNETIFCKKVKNDYAKEYADVYSDFFISSEILMDSVNTKEELIEYMKKNAPAKEIETITYDLEIYDFLPAISGTRDNTFGTYGCAQAKIFVENNIPGGDFQIVIFPISILPTPYKSSSESSNGSNSSKSGAVKYSPSAYNEMLITKDNITIGTWEQIGDKWKLKLSNGLYASAQWALLNERWYVLGHDGIMKTDWQKVNGKWYFLSNDGSMLTGWRFINEKWYWMDNDGAMLENGKTPDGYTVNENGELI